MLYLLLAIASSALISIFMRLSTGRIRNNVAMLAVNYAACLLIACGYAGVCTTPGALFPAADTLPATLLMGGIHGSLYLFSFVLLQRSVRRNGVVLSALFQRLGLLVPLVVSVFAFHEIPTPVQIIGFVLAILAILLMNLGGDASLRGAGAGLLLLLLSGGLGDAMSKIFEQLGDPALSPQFLLYTFGAALLLCVALMLYKKQLPGKSELLFGVLIGIPNFFSARFLLRSLEELAAVIVYPTFSVAAILVVTLAGVLFFKERLRPRQWIALSVILTALVLLNL